jgi:hypothetical protein
MGTANDLDYEHEKEMTSSELFFDLIFVVGIARLGEHARQREGISIEDGSYIEFFASFCGTIRRPTAPGLLTMTPQL